MQRYDKPFCTQGPVEFALESSKLNIIDKKKINITEGNCAGISQKGVEEYLLGDFSIFAARMVFLRRNYDAYLLLKYDKPDEAQAFRKNFEAKLQKPKNSLLLSHILTYQKPASFRKKLGRSLVQSRPVTTSRLLASGKVAQRGGLHNLSFFLNFYSQSELTDLLKLIEKHAKSTKIAFTASCNQHQIAIGLDGTSRQWTLIEPNSFSAKTTTPDELAKKIFTAFTFDKTFTHAGIALRGFTLGKDDRRLNRRAIAALKKDPAFQQLQFITPEKLQMKDDRSYRLFRIAAYEGCLSMLKKLHHDSTSPAEIKYAFFTAVKYNHLHIVNYLIDYNRKLLTKANYKGRTGLYIAAARNFSELVSYFLNQGADPFQESKDRFSPLTVAIANDSKESLQFFLKHRLDLTRRDSSGMTPFKFAQMNNRSV